MIVHVLHSSSEWVEKIVGVIERGLGTLTFPFALYRIVSFCADGVVSHP